MAKHCGPYRYVRRFFGIGEGAQNFALLSNGTPPPSGSWGPRNDVRGSLNPTCGALAYSPKDGPEVDLKADGVYIPGQIALQRLSEKMKGGA